MAYRHGGRDESPLSMSFDAGSADAGGPDGTDEQPRVIRARTGGDGGQFPELDGALEEAALEAAQAVLRRGLAPFGLVQPEQEDGSGQEVDDADAHGHGAAGPAVDGDDEDAGGALDEEDQEPSEGVQRQRSGGSARRDVGGVDAGGGGQQRNARGGAQMRPVNGDRPDDSEEGWGGGTAADLLQDLLDSGAELVDDAARALA